MKEFFAPSRLCDFALKTLIIGVGILAKLSDFT